MITNARTFDLGDCFRDTSTNELWMIGASGNGYVSLYCIRGGTGTRWKAPMMVNDTWRITCDEVKRLIGTSWKRWEYAILADIHITSVERFQDEGDLIDSVSLGSVGVWEELNG